MQGLTLVLNAAEGRLQLVLADGAELLCAQDWAAARRGTELLAPALERIFSGLRLRFGDLERIACVRGPGSFTGIRLVLATAAALARASGALQAGLDYMQALALGARAFGEENAATRIWVVQHVRRDLALAQCFAWEQSEALPRAVSGLDLLTPEQCLQRMREEAQTGMRLWAMGSALARHAEFSALPGLATCVPARPGGPPPEDLLLLARHAEYSCRDIEALYARPCDAEENPARRYAAGRGTGVRQGAP
ncbi:MAG: tRNA (adenosine(37)-N6)-threonylcarbamoyltransferase complex dimerization subunit type 1 TsaB [Deltaproteobacteria bacterium]|jgi:tRNA threonylcarbamoyl adenosine modification protein YeaZ|nr:tRNA (adenosine(37)-N6)-threonylcarbamoyltransferase complex dimerization subunit type 1 TsaB [Deltaproteobacteria bacterium]